MLAKWIRRVLLGSSVIVLGLNGPAGWADCKTQYQQTKTLLDATLKKATANQHPDADAFNRDFQTKVESLQAEKCLPELMSLMQYIQAEQKKYPQNPPNPVLD